MRDCEHPCLGLYWSLSKAIFAFDHLHREDHSQWLHGDSLELAVFMLAGKSPVFRLRTPQAQILSERERKGEAPA